MRSAAAMLLLAFLAPPEASAGETEAAEARAAATESDAVQTLPCRPTIACTADMVPSGVFELEVGNVFRKLAGPLKQDALPWLAKLTLIEGVQLQVGGNGPTLFNTPALPGYLDDVVLGLKFQLVKQLGPRPSVSWSVALSVPVSSASGYLSTDDVLTTLYVTKDFAWLHADFNLGLDLWNVRGPIQTQGWLALALSVEVVPKWTVMAESYGFSDASPVAARDAGLLAALAFAPEPWLVLDVGADVGFLPSQRAYSLFTGMTFALPLWGMKESGPAAPGSVGTAGPVLARAQPLH